MNTTRAFATFFVLFIFFSCVNAHFRFFQPLPRGGVENTHTPPCGGHDTVNTTAITDFPIKDGLVITRFGHGLGIARYYYAPTSNDSFVLVSNDIAVNAETEAVVLETPIDLTKANANINDMGVLQAVLVFYNVSQQNMYVCADIKVVSENSTTTSKSDASIVYFSSSRLGITFFAIVLAAFIMSL